MPRIKQTVVRTFPKGYTNAIESLDQHLNNGWIVVMCNPFYCEGKTGNEYILQKEVED